MDQRVVLSALIQEGLLELLREGLLASLREGLSVLRQANQRAYPQVYPRENLQADRQVQQRGEVLEKKQEERKSRRHHLGFLVGFGRPTQPRLQ